MKFAHVILFGALLGAGPAAMADTILGTLTTNSVGTNGGAAVNATNLAFNVSPSPGQVVSGTGTFSTLASGTSVNYDPGDANTSIKWSTLSPTKPALLLEVGSFKVYITSASDITVGTNGRNGTMGSFNATGYVTDDGGLTTTPIKITWTSSTTGSGKVAFTETITSLGVAAPEPSSIFLLGSGMLTTVGAAVRRRRSNS